jgi:non-ribosomal peptide synthetase-like protein
MVNGAYESVVAPVLAILLGTPFAAPLLRLMGCRIGRHTYLGTTLMSEFDLVEIGDHAALNQGVVLQNHLFEDRVFKSSHLTIGPEVSVGNMTVVLYDTAVGRGAAIGPLSLLMKGETLTAGSRWQGIPTERVAAGAVREAGERVGGG